MNAARVCLRQDCGTPLTRRQQYCCSRACYRIVFTTTSLGAETQARRRESFRRTAARRATRYASKAQAYAVGYKTGYLAAWRFWRARVARNTGRAA